MTRKWTIQPYTNLLRRKILGWTPADLKSLAVKTWEINPSETTISPPAYYLPNQLERVTGWAYSNEHPKRDMEGGVTNEHSPTLAHLIKDVWLLDGTLYKGNAATYLQPQSVKLPPLHASVEHASGAIYCSAGGNEFFGQWLLDDCTTYPLASNFGEPITTCKKISPHRLSYKTLFGMPSLKFENAFFKELYIFDDIGQNLNKRARFKANKDKVLVGLDAKSHPGVFVIRGNSGVQRNLTNELELAEHLRVKRGFRVLDPMSTDVETIRNVCAGAETIIGVEGSHLIHGLMTLKENGSLVSIMPPNRFYALNKNITDRDHQHFGFVVGMPNANNFSVNIDEVDRTLDLLPKTNT